ncbi:MAG: UvrD-helicase domain-containing protein [Bacteroidales bacterium]|nr:UvrD-helicase domain-containing protein [Bacteroidales bacterium]
MSDLLSQLNEPQREAAECTEGPVMIIAGAGSGKTRTLTYRIAHLVEQGVDPFHILALTFTNKAAGEMKDRIIKLVGSEARNIWMGTFHSVFARLLRSDGNKLGYTNSFTIYDTDDTKAAIKQVVKQLNLDPKAYKPSYVASRISMAKSNLLGPKDYMENPEIYQTDIDAKRPAIGQIYQMYDQRLHNSNAMDFDDLLFNMNILLRDFPDVLLKYQQRFQYIMVDEYQDTNYAQYLIVKKLAARHQNICVVGDDAQSIYAFRGANIQNIFNFKRDYPQMQLFKLEQNYRSTKNIVQAANSIIGHNRDQIEKELWSDNAVGGKIHLMRCADEKDEGTRVADAIQNARLGDDADYRDFAVLYRQNSLSRAVEDALRKMNIPYRIYQGISFYGRREVKDALSYMRLAVNPHDDESLVRVINYPARGIGQTSMDKIRVAAADNDISIWTVLENIQDFGLGLNSGIVQRITDFVFLIKRFGAQVPTVDAFTLAKQIIYASGIVKALQEEDDPENTDRINNIEELLNGVQEFCEEAESLSPHPPLLEGEGGQDSSDSHLLSGEGAGVRPLRTLDEFLQQVLLYTSEDKDKDKDADKVSLMTIHAAKGLEFPYVFVVGMEEQIFPSFMAMSRPELEEERRLFYVAVTRAEKQVTLSYAQTRFNNGQRMGGEVSRFVEEIDPQYIEMPKRAAFPEAGTLPSAFFNAGKPKETVKKKVESVKRPSGPTVPNNPATINAIMPGMKVQHDKFGVGSVQAVEGNGDSRKAIVFFGNGVGQKQLMLKFAKLTIIES